MTGTLLCDAQVALSALQTLFFILLIGFIRFLYYTLKSYRIQASPHPRLIVFRSSTGDLLDPVKNKNKTGAPAACLDRHSGAP